MQDAEVTKSLLVGAGSPPKYLGYSLRTLCFAEASLCCMEAGRRSFLLPIVPCVFATFWLLLFYENTQQEDPAGRSFSLACVAGGLGGERVRANERNPREE